MQNRLENLQLWIAEHIVPDLFQIEAMPGDASHRQYFRITSEEQSWIAMDVPPEVEHCGGFIRVAQSFAAHGIPVPTIIAANAEQGFVLTNDLGKELLLDTLNEKNVDAFYKKALDILIQIQHCQPTHELAYFNQVTIRAELQRFEFWFLQRMLNINMSASQRGLLERLYALLIDVASDQPQVCIHRDYHAGNLMVLPEGGLAVIDFQDALWGPISYDVVSLLRDSRIAWPADKVDGWLAYYKNAALNKGLLSKNAESDFKRWFDWQGLQLHLKILGIFARLALRDNKKVYLQHIPRLMAYINDVVSDYTELHEFQCLLNEIIIPKVKTCQLL